MRSGISTPGAKSLLLGGLLLAAIAAAVLGTIVTAGSGIPWPGPLSIVSIVLVRAVLNISALTTVGMCLVPFLLSDGRTTHTRPIMVLARRATAVAGLTWLVTALAALVVQAVEFSPGSRLSANLVAEYVANVSAGAALLISAAAAGGCVVLSLLALRYGDSFPDPPRTFIAILGLLPIPLTGHAANREYGLSLLSVELHVLAAALWAGGLIAVVLLIAPHRGLLAHAVPRFSTLATAAILTVGVSGLFNGLAELAGTPVTGLTGLVTTGYGAIVLTKTACLVILAALGGHIRFRLLPRIVRHQRTALVAWVAMEILVTGVTYGLGTALARSPVI